MYGTDIFRNVHSYSLKNVMNNAYGHLTFNMLFPATSAISDEACCVNFYLPPII